MSSPIGVDIIGGRAHCAAIVRSLAIPGLLLFLVACGGFKEPDPNAAKVIGLAPGNTAPSWVLERLDSNSTEGLKDYRGKILVLDFWASWCGPCRRELPQLEALYTEFKDQGVVVLGISVDDTAGPAVDMAKRLGLSFPLFFDKEGRKTERDYQISTLPTTMVLDAQGRVRGRHVGFSPMTTRQIRGELRKLLEESHEP